MFPCSYHRLHVIQITNLQCDLLQKCKETGSPFDVRGVSWTGLSLLLHCTVPVTVCCSDSFDTGLEGVCACACARVCTYACVLL